ncbi:MAG: hypothetical protein RL069_1105 [Planctomycetota bacterium]|jgi:hypothetical protein
MLPLKKGQTRKIRSVVSDPTVGVTQRIMTILPVPTTNPFHNHSSFSDYSNSFSKRCAKVVRCWLAELWSLVLNQFHQAFLSDSSGFGWGVSNLFQGGFSLKTGLAGVFSSARIRETVRIKRVRREEVLQY